MQCLVDFDVLVYEIGHAAEAGWKQPGFPPFEYVEQLLNNKILTICAITNSDEPPILYATGKTNFRNEIAKRQKYKDRPSNKPFHYKNILAYGKAVYDVRIQEGLEADDLMAIEQTKNIHRTIICTRDKDLRAVSGWQFGWELGNQPQIGPYFVEPEGCIRLSRDRKKIIGDGTLFFYSQCLTGDRVDSIPGLPGCGAVQAFNTLDGYVDIQDAFKRVLEAYRGVYGPNAEMELLEQGRLLNMSREMKDNSVLLWEFPGQNYKEWINVNTNEITRTFNV